MLDPMPVAAQRSHEFGEQREGVVERPHVGDLRADVHIDADHGEPGQGAGALIDGAGARDRHAELVLRLSGRNLGVRVSVDVWVDADSDARRIAAGARDFGQRFQFGLGLDVEAEDALVKPERHLVSRLADAREDDLVARHAG